MTKQQRLKLPKYLATAAKYVPHCVECGTTEGVQNAHYSGLYSDRLGSGMGSKSHDYCVARLCRDCHVKMDNYAEGNDEERAADFIDAIMETLRLLHWAGRETVPAPKEISQQPWITPLLKKMLVGGWRCEKPESMIDMLARQRDFVGENGK